MPNNKRHKLKKRRWRNLDPYEIKREDIVFDDSPNAQREVTPPRFSPPFKIERIPKEGCKTPLYYLLKEKWGRDLSRMLKAEIQATTSTPNKKFKQQQLRNHRYTIDDSTRMIEQDYHSQLDSDSDSDSLFCNGFIENSSSDHNTWLQIPSRMSRMNSRGCSLIIPEPASISESVFKICNQNEPLTFNEVLKESDLVRKIAEGSFGEIYELKTSDNRAQVVKIIPVGESKQLVDGIEVMPFNEVYSELIITQSLSDLRENNKPFLTSNFTKINKAKVVKGSYPPYLIKMWKLYALGHKTENICPEVFNDDQLFVLMYFDNAGGPLEDFQFLNARQSLSVLKQIIFAISVAEVEHRFEHRDLHLGNILVSPTEETSLMYKIQNQEYEVQTFGLKATVIDFTLSCMQTRDGTKLFHDLKNASWFHIPGENSQDAVYLEMRTVLENNWEQFLPKTNILWVHYIAQKLTTGDFYKNKKTAIHRCNMFKLRRLKNSILTYNSCYDLVSEINF